MGLQGVSDQVVGQMRHLETKVHALAAYESQGFRPYSSPGFIRSLATVRGVQAGATYAEAFEPIQLVVR